MCSKGRGHAGREHGQGEGPLGRSPAGPPLRSCPESPSHQLLAAPPTPGPVHLRVDPAAQLPPAPPGPRRMSPPPPDPGRPGAGERRCITRRACVPDNVSPPAASPVLPALAAARPCPAPKAGSEHARSIGTSRDRISRPRTKHERTRIRPLKLRSNGLHRLRTASWY